MSARRPAGVHEAKHVAAGLDLWYQLTCSDEAAASGQSKAATLEGGAEIQVPLFVEIGDKVKVKCAEREFIERAKK